MMLKMTRTFLIIGYFLLTSFQCQETPHSYAPQTVACPSSSLIRYSGTVTDGNQALSPEEADYTHARRSQVLPGAYRDYLANAQYAARRHGVAFPSYVSQIMSGSPDHLPRVSAAISGGGLRATYSGAGILNAFDGRNRTSSAAGTGGLLQVLDHVAGLSGGACLIMALAQANFPTLYEAALGPDEPRIYQEDASLPNGNTNSWLGEKNFVAPAGLSDGNPVVLDAAWWVTVADQVNQKAQQGFDVTLGDIYARVLGYHFVNGTTRENFFDPNGAHGLGETLSGLRNVPKFRSFSQPFPIITAVPDSPRQNESELQQGAAVPITNNQYEFNLFESGSWDPNLAAFVKTSYLGTSLERGRPRKGSKRCVINFDNLGFLIATSSNIFRKYDGLASLFMSKLYQPILPAFEVVLSSVPNPFKKLGTREYLDRNTDNLGLMDGSFGGENIPFAPLLPPARMVEVIIAFDASDDREDGWADGTSIINTSKRSKLMPEGAYPFPQIPKETSEIDSSRPTLFGCEEPVGIPLVVYIPNSPPTDGSAPVTNLPTATLQVSREKAVEVIDAATKLAWRGINEDPLWPACLACAVVDRRRERLGEAREGLCVKCFQLYCNTKA